ncbi:MAG TPA: hypothetical protein VEK08_12130 [Planctomycetota bacterium]|nr:hypothetical protein [Planctomycetota bacterium]
MKPIVSPNTRVRHPQHLVVGEDSIIDDYCYISTRLHIGRGSHVASGCSIAGGADRLCTIGDYCSLSSGVKIWCTSNDFVNDLVAIIPAAAGIKTTSITGDVTLGNFTGIGANAVVMPDNTIPEGTVIGSLSFVPAAFKFESWSVYAGTPIRLIRRRNRENVLAQVKQLDAHYGITRTAAHG